MSKKLYYIANSIYQFAYALPVYQQLGGVFVVNSPKKYKHFLQQFRNLACHGERNPMHTPDVIIVAREDYQQLSGLLFFLANSISPDHDYKDAICLFHEHGTSDKLYEGGQPIAVHKLNKYDAILLSGPKNKQRLEEIGADTSDARMVEVGALRFDHFLSAQWNRETECRKLGIKELQRKNILYAPTWKFGQGTLRQHFLSFARALNREYNLILRPHYHDRKEAYCWYLLARAMGLKNVYYSNAADLQNRDTYVDFLISDLLISDMSSVVYEYLITQNPIVIIENQFKERHEMPEHLSARAVAEVYQKGDDIRQKVSQALSSASEKAYAYHRLLHACFYEPEGGAVSRAIAHIRSLL